MGTRKPNNSDASLPFAALQLLAPPVRLVSAALWKVMQQRDVMQYGVAEEFVTSACETVPGLLTVRHQAKLALGLRGRLILELCSMQPNEEVIVPHLERIRAPAGMASASGHTVKRDVKIMKTVESFQSMVRTLLKNPTEREQFFKEDFPMDYGPKFDQELEKLLWEFLVRLDQLLPVPNLAQTVSWLNESPPVLEECARAATQPQLLKILLEHQSSLGHLDSAASLPPNMGDSILASLSLPPSGRAPSDEPTAAKNPETDRSNVTQTRDQTGFITPVIGLISNEDVPVMATATKRTLIGNSVTNKHVDPEENLKFTVVKPREIPKDGVKECEEEEEEEEEERNVSRRSSGVKRKKPDKRESDSDEEDATMLRKKTSKSSPSEAGNQRMSENGEDGATTSTDGERNGAALEAKTLHLPQDPFLRSIVASCLSSRPRVVVERLSVTSLSANRLARGGIAFYKNQQTQRRKSPVKVPTHKSTRTQLQKPESEFLGLDDKENHPVLPSVSGSSSQHRRNTETVAPPGDGEDYVADSEDEATKNFKGRLFMKRYYKTKHGTYVPTLREYWKPGTTRRDLTTTCSKRR